MSVSLNIIDELRSSVKELSKEVLCLGLKPLECNDSNQATDICEVLLNTSWQLVQLIHCNTSGLLKDVYSTESEMRRLDNLHALQKELSHMKDQVEKKDRLLGNNKETIRQLRSESKKHKEDADKQKQLAETSIKQIKEIKNIMKNEIIKREVSCEQLKEIIRKSAGMGTHLSLARSISEMSVADSRAPELDEDVVKSSMMGILATNQELVDENLMLRDALHTLHADLQSIGQAGEQLMDELHIKEEGNLPHKFPSNIFQLPLSHCFKKLSDLRKSQISSVNTFLSTIRAYVQYKK